MRLKSSRHGKADTGVAVTGISDEGVELVVDGRKVVLTYEDFPWFEGAPEKHIRNVRRPHAWHLRWPGLDVDLEVDSIFAPERYPLKFGNLKGGDSGSANANQRNTR
jgi:uncharacterized protein DUF2442